MKLLSANHTVDFSEHYHSRYTAMNNFNNSPCFSITSFTIKPGLLDDFIREQIEGVNAFSNEVKHYGWLGNRTFRSEENNLVILVAAFKSEADKNAWASTETFRKHVQRVSPYIDNAHNLSADLIMSGGEINYLHEMKNNALGWLSRL